jgi:hypothetical protein
MTDILIWGAVALVLGYLIFGFWRALNKDSRDLGNQTLAAKFSIIVDMINNYAFGGLGSTYAIGKREFNLYKDMENQIIKFQYSTGHLTIIWKFKWYQREVVYQQQFNHVRNISDDQQKVIGEQMITEMSIVIERHKHGL